MGANAQTTVPTFTAGEVLTAAQQNASARTGVPVFATTGTRDAGFGGTGEKTLAEGQLCYVEGTGLQSYNGSSWVTWGTAPSSGALVAVKAQTAFSAVSSFQADSVFTSTYTNYLVRILGKNSANAVVSFQLRSGGSTTATNYNISRLNQASTTVTGEWSTGQTSFRLIVYGDFEYAIDLYLYAPQLSEVTRVMVDGTECETSATQPYQRRTTGNQNSTTAFDGIIVSAASGTMTGTYTIYGFAKS